MRPGGSSSRRHPNARRATFIGHQHSHRPCRSRDLRRCTSGGGTVPSMSSQADRGAQDGDAVRGAGRYAWSLLMNRSSHVLQGGGGMSGMRSAGMISPMLNSWWLSPHATARRCCSLRVVLTVEGSSSGSRAKPVLPTWEVSHPGTHCCAEG